MAMLKAKKCIDKVSAEIITKRKTHNFINAIVMLIWLCLVHNTM